MPSFDLFLLISVCFSFEVSTFILSSIFKKCNSSNGTHLFIVKEIVDTQKSVFRAKYNPPRFLQLWYHVHIEELI